MLCLAEIESIRCSEYGFAATSWLGLEVLVVDTCRCSELVYRYSKIVVMLQRVCISPQQESLPCNFWTCCIIIEMLYWNNYIFDEN